METETYNETSLHLPQVEDYLVRIVVDGVVVAHLEFADGVGTIEKIADAPLRK